MKAKIALITGGYTGESEISYKSSDFVYQQLDKDVYDVYLVHLLIDEWYYQDASGRKFPINRNDFSLEMDDQVHRFDLAFIMLHGIPGEDGRLQGYLDMVGLPYTSCDAATSALTMNKGYTKAVLKGIPELYLANSVLLFEAHRPDGYDRVVAQLQLPFFVKPNAGGSSIGMSKVKNLMDLNAALDKAFDAENTGNQVIVEEFVNGREFSVGIFRRLDGSLKVLPATEVKASREFFDFEAKYTPGLTQELTPAPLTAEQLQRVECIVKEVYIRLNCAGMVRVDFFLENHTDHFYFIEINTIPGQTPQSFIPQQVRAAGMQESEFYSELIEVVLQR